MLHYQLTRPTSQKRTLSHTWREVSTRSPLALLIETPLSVHSRCPSVCRHGASLIQRAALPPYPDNVTQTHTFAHLAQDKCEKSSLVTECSNFSDCFANIILLGWSLNWEISRSSGVRRVYSALKQRLEID